MNKSLILIADDDKDDQLLIQDAFQEIDFTGELRFVNNGIELLTYLTTLYTLPIPPDDMPNLILLDLNMPKMTGQDALKAIKGNTFLRLIPIIVFSTSGHQANINNCYELGANSYIIKPLHYSQLLKTAKNIEQYWFSTACITAKLNMDS